MQFTVELPDELAQHILPQGVDPSRTALEDMAVEAYRNRRLTDTQLAGLLGMTRLDLDGFLKRREVWLDYSVEDLERDLEAHRQLGF